MTFAHPAYLWALTGLAIPLAIHLLSRKEGRVIRVGSLRHVEESNTSQFKSIRLNEILLWLLRSLIVISLVMFLSGASCTSPSGSNQSKWVVIENGIYDEPQYKQSIDSLTSSGYELRYLQNGFPKQPIAGELNYRHLIEELALLPHDVVVISWSKGNNFNGLRTPLPSNVQWISADVKDKNYLAAAWNAGDSIMTRSAAVDVEGTQYTTAFNNVNGDSLKVISPDKILISVSTEAKHRSESDILLAALNVIKSEYHLPVEILSKDVQGDPQWIFWFRDAQPKFDGSKQVVFISEENHRIIERISNNVTHIKSLNQEVAINENLVSELIHLLYPFQELYTSAKAKELTPVPEPIAWSDKAREDVGDTQNTAHADLGKYFIALLLLSIAAERFVAIRRNQ